MSARSSRDMWYSIVRRGSSDGPRRRMRCRDTSHRKDLQKANAHDSLKQARRLCWQPSVVWRSTVNGRFMVLRSHQREPPGDPQRKFAGYSLTPASRRSTKNFGNAGHGVRKRPVAGLSSTQHGASVMAAMFIMSIAPRTQMYPSPIGMPRDRLCHFSMVRSIVLSPSLPRGRNGGCTSVVGRSPNRLARRRQSGRHGLETPSC